MSKIKNGGLDQYGKVQSLNGIGGERVKTTAIRAAGVDTVTLHRTLHTSVCVCVCVCVCVFIGKWQLSITLDKRCALSLGGDHFYQNTTTLRSNLCYRKCVCRLSSVCLSVTFVCPTQGVETFGNIFHQFVP